MPLAWMILRITSRSFTSIAASGFAVMGLDRRGIAAAKGIRPGDIIVSVGNTPVRAPADVTDGIRRAEEEARAAVLLLMHRNGEDRYVALPLPKGWMLTRP